MPAESNARRDAARTRRDPLPAGEEEGEKRLPDDRLALLAEELLDVVGSQRRLAGGAGPLPAAEGIDARPGPRGRPRPAVGVGDSGLDLVEEPLHLALVLAEDAGGQPVIGVVGPGDRLVARLCPG